MEKMVSELTIECYGRVDKYKVSERKKLIRTYAENVRLSEGCEKERYANVLADLILGYVHCRDY